MPCVVVTRDFTSGAKTTTVLQLSTIPAHARQMSIPFADRHRQSSIRCPEPYDECTPPVQLADRKRNGRTYPGLRLVHNFTRCDRTMACRTRLNLERLSHRPNSDGHLLGCRLLATLYNDAWRPIVGGKHPWAFGKPVETSGRNYGRRFNTIFAVSSPQERPTGEATNCYPCNGSAIRRMLLRLQPESHPGSGTDGSRGF